MKVLVTGGGGFLGGAIVKRLLGDAHEVSVFSRATVCDSPRIGVTYLSGDVCDLTAVNEACAGMDVVFHVAAKVGAWGEYQEFYNINVVGTKNVVAACKAQKVKRLIYTSSPSVVFGDEAIRNGNEDLPYASDFMSDYQRTKAEAEQLVLSANSPDKLVTAALRPHAVWGVGDNHLIPRIIQLGEKGKLKVVGTGKNKISMTHVENAAAAHVQAMMSENVGGKAYFINDPSPVVLWQWIAALLEGVGLPVPKKKIPFSAAYFIAFLNENVCRLLPFLGEPSVTRYMVSLLSKDHYFETKQAVNDFDYRPVVSADVGVKELVEHLKIEFDGKRADVAGAAL